MDAQQFLAEFGHIANAPGGVAQLRQMIYQLAVIGSLTPRSEGNDDAEFLLSDVELTRKNLIREKKYKRIPKLESEPVRPPHSIILPQSWRWTRLLDLGEINPRNEAPDDQLAAFVTMSGVPQLHHGTVVAEIRRWGELKNGFAHFANGDVILAKITPCFENGKAAVITDLPGDSGFGAGTTELQVFRPVHAGILPEYVYLFLRSPLFVAEGKKRMTGTAGQQRLRTDYFATRAFPLPPTAEQARIVTKVDELMALCDELDAQQQHQRRLQHAVRQSTFQAFAGASHSRELQAAWARLTENFGQLFSAPEDVRQFRDAVIDLALRGALLPDALFSGKRPTADRPPLPREWKWVNLADLAEYITSGSRGWNAYLANAGDRFIRSQDIRHNVLIFENPAFVALPEKAEGKRTQVQHGDILLTITGGNVGRCAIVPALTYDAYVSQHIALIRLRDPELSEFIHFWMINAYGGRKFLSRYIYGDKPGLNLSQVGSVPIPLPPEAARIPILENVRAYQKICDRFETELRSKKDIAAALAGAAVASLTGSAIEQEEDEFVKAPQTELIAPLQLGQTPNVKAHVPLATILAHHDGEMGAKELWQRFGRDIDAFYAQLKTEVLHGWIQEPSVAEVRERLAETEVV